MGKNIDNKQKEDEGEITGYHLKCNNCGYKWNTKYAQISAKCPSCNKRIHGTNNYTIVTTHKYYPSSGCCMVGLIPATILFLPFITICPNKTALLKIIDFHSKYSSPTLNKAHLHCGRRLLKLGCFCEAYT